MKKSLQVLKSFTSKELPILESCLISVKGGKTTFRVHNLDECAEFTTMYEGNEFEACVNMKSLISALGKQNHFELVRNELIVTGVRLPTFPVDHFPCMYEGVPEPMGILPLHEINSNVLWASGTEGISSKLSLQGVHICNENGRLVVVASDGSRMSVLETNEPTKLPEGVGYTIPNKAMELLTKIAKSQSSVEYSVVGGKFLEFSAGAFRMISRPIPEKFPNYKAVIREGIKSMATFSLKDFTCAFDEKFDEFDRVEIVFANNKLSLIAYKGYGVSILETIPCSGAMQEGRYMISTYYLGMLKRLPYEDISVDYDPTSGWANAVIFHTEGYKYLVMPIRT